MPTIVRYIIAFIIFMHGLVHLLYFVSYWPIAQLEEIPYKTTLFNNRWDVGAGGIRFFALLCLLVALGFVIAAIAFALQASWWSAWMTAMAILSMILTAMDFSVAYGGPIVDGLILILVLLAPRLDL